VAGNPYPIDEALAIEDHPNGTLDWVPLSDKAAHDLQFLSAIKAVAERPSVFNVYPSEVTVTPSDPPVVNVTVPQAMVTVNPPVVNVKAAVTPDVNVTVTPELRITSMPDRITERRIDRDKAGRIIRTTDAETDA
jgi:hypothetical protein